MGEPEPGVLCKMVVVFPNGKSISSLLLTCDRDERPWTERSVRERARLEGGVGLVRRSSASPPHRAPHLANAGD